MSDPGVVIVGAAGAAVSMVIVRASDAELTFPAASVAVTVITCAPELSAVTGVKLHAPPAPAVAVPIELAPSRIVTVEFGSALPASAGLVSLVEMFVDGVVIVGAAGVPVSIVKLRVADPELPAVSLAVTVTECGPSLSTGVVNGELQESAAPPSTAQVVVLGFASDTANVTLGVLSASAAPAVGALIETTGSTVSTLNETVADPTLPARSVCRTVTACAPSVNAGVVNGELHGPYAPASTAQAVVPGLASVTVKETSGVGSIACDPSAGALIDTAGVVVSTVIVSGADCALTFPAASVAVPLSVKTPSTALPSGGKIQVPAALVCTVPAGKPR
ncbi:MAG: hypothetical protein Q7V62_02065 [Actinomycetota bacterium]|nr:hypothetical protein [Actinomycetota bacterium]